MVLILFENSLTGPIPIELSRLPSLLSLSLFKNQLTGNVVLSSSLRNIYLHQNQLTGRLQSFENFHSLGVLSIFNNRFRGTLQLPPHQLQLLYTHNNHLSCMITAVNTSMRPYNPNQTWSPTYQYPDLVLLGNVFTSPVPPWLTMSSVKFLQVQRDFFINSRFSHLSGVSTIPTISTIHLHPRIHSFEQHRVFCRCPHRFGIRIASSISA